MLLALPPSAVRMIHTPQWSPAKMHALRAMRFDPIRKIGLLFKCAALLQDSTMPRSHPMPVLKSILSERPRERHTRQSIHASDDGATWQFEIAVLTERAL